MTGVTPSNPWLEIPAADYEGHMGETGVDQLGPLREILARVYQEVRPRRVAVLGCGPGGGLEIVDPACTERLVGVDLNPDYLALARERHSRLEAIAEWKCVPVQQCDLPAATFDLIHAALMFEYVDPAEVLPAVARWLAPQGVLSVVLQLPGGDAPISDTGFSRLGLLSGLMQLVPPDRLCALAARVGLILRSSAEVPLARGKRFWTGTFARGDRASPT